MQKFHRVISHFSSTLDPYLYESVVSNIIVGVMFLGIQERTNFRLTALFFPRTVKVAGILLREVHCASVRDYVIYITNRGLPQTKHVVTLQTLRKVLK